MARTTSKKGKGSGKKSYSVLEANDSAEGQEDSDLPKDEAGRRKIKRQYETLLAIDIATGVRHQIRVHLAAAGHPVCGDPLYGGSAAARLMLHAAALSLRHPLSGTRLSLECLPPSDFTAPA